MSIFWTAVVLSAPENKTSYHVQQGGLVNITDGTFVEGSVGHGGIQPDYIIDLSHPDLAAFLDKVKLAVDNSKFLKYIKNQGNNYLLQIRTIELVTGLIAEALPGKSYDGLAYRLLLEEHRLQNIDISLGSYLQCQAGVCRENALLTHLALKKVGIESHFVYALVKQYQKQEDHAFVVVENEKGRWIVDPYNSNFHGKNYDDLLDPDAGGKLAPRFLDFAPSNKNIIKIIHINKFPTYWIPKIKRLSCSKVFN